jgi:hypothetical protein
MVWKGHWVCAVKNRARSREQYERRKQDPARLAVLRANWRRHGEKRKDDPIYLLEKQLRDLVRVRY